jgi:MFS transporter, DHA1 family, multidrug resistance protein
MQPRPQIAGAAGATTGFVQMTIGAVSSGLVATLYNGHSALSMTALMALCSVLALVSYLLLARPASASSCRLEGGDTTLPSLSAFRHVAR